MQWPKGHLHSWRIFFFSGSPGHWSCLDAKLVILILAIPALWKRNIDTCLVANITSRDRTIIPSCPDILCSTISGEINPHITVLYNLHVSPAWTQRETSKKPNISPGIWNPCILCSEKQVSGQDEKKISIPTLLKSSVLSWDSVLLCPEMLIPEICGRLKGNPRNAWGSRWKSTCNKQYLVG